MDDINNMIIGSAKAQNRGYVHKMKVLNRRIYKLRLNKNELFKAIRRNNKLIKKLEV